MLEKYSVHTDLALEEKERFASDDVEVQGVVLEETYDEKREMKVTTVRIETEKGAKAMGKPVGTYITMEIPNLVVPDEEYHQEVAKELARYIQSLLPEKRKEYGLLVVGLGNREVTPDALGPGVVDHLHVNRHIIQEYGKYAMGDAKVQMISAIAPGVMAQTGMESCEIVKGIVEQTHPDVVLVVDALAARNSKRLNRTIQIADTGIHPGAGVGNHRCQIDRETMGVPVIAIGVPTVVDAATIVNDTMENLIEALETSETLKGVGVVLQGYNATEKYELIKELISPHLHGMFVTPKDIDETMARISRTVAESVDLLAHGFHTDGTSCI